MKHLPWILAAALSAWACHLAVHHATPIDRALPFIAVVIVFVAWAEVTTLLAIPALVLAEIAIADESTRLLAFGVIVAAGFLGPSVPRSLGTRPRGTEEPRNRGTALVVASILLLRWIPFEHVLVWRELFLLAVAVAIVLVLGRTPFAIAVAVITALVTPAVPVRTLALPLLVLFAAILGRSFGMPAFRATVPSVIALAFVLLFFAWSGIVARAFPYFLKPARPLVEKHIVNAAIAPARSETLHVPDGARALIVSGANVPDFRRGAILGRIDPGNIVIRVGDAADWGYMRRDQIYGSRNPLPRDPAGKIRDYGYLAWVDGAGRVALPRGAKTIRVTASSSLPQDASLQVEGFEIVRR